MITLRIRTHDREEFFEEVEHYDPHELNEQINNDSVLTIVIGQRIISRLKIAEISVVEEPEETLLGVDGK